MASEFQKATKLENVELKSHHLKGRQNRNVDLYPVVSRIRTKDPADSKASSFMKTNFHIPGWYFTLALRWTPGRKGLRSGPGTSEPYVYVQYIEIWLVQSPPLIFIHPASPTGATQQVQFTP